MNKKISKEDVLQDIKSTIEKTKKYSLQDYARHGKYSTTTVGNILPNGWNAFIKSLGYKPAKEYGISKEELVNDVKKVFQETGCTKQENYIHHGKFSKAAIKRIFGGWNKMLNALGYEVNMTKPGQYTKADVLNDYLRVKKDFGRPLSAKEYRAHGKFSQPVVDRVFGSFSGLKKQLGERVDGRFVSDKEIWSDIKNIANTYHVLSDQLLCQECIVSLPTILKRIGNIDEISKKLNIPKAENRKDSKLSQQCIAILKDYLGDKFQKEKTYPWLVNPKTGWHLYVDFMYEDLKLAIEVDGQQHYAISNMYSRNEEKLRTVQFRDRQKELLLQNHGYKIVRLRYPKKEYIEQKLRGVNMI